MLTTFDSSEVRLLSLSGVSFACLVIDGNVDKTIEKHKLSYHMNHKKRNREDELIWNFSKPNRPEISLERER